MRTAGIALALLLLLAACGGEAKENPPSSSAPPASLNAPEAGASAETPPATPDAVTVDHILIGVQGRIPNGKPPAEARALAYDLLKKIKGGADWAALKREYSADPPPGGPYTMLMKGTPNRAKMIFLRSDMAPSFGDVGFSLAVGQVGMADYDPAKSPFGYHIIKRVK